MAGTDVSGNSQSYHMINATFQSALLNTIPERCAILTQLLQDTPAKELQCIFPSLIENIFGFRSGIDWGLVTLDKEVQLKECDAIMKFLGPDGPLLKLVFKFIEECSPKFEFPILCLPLPTQLILKEGKVPALYTNKLQIMNPGVFPSSLQLNAFEFYFFHFTYCIVNLSVKNSLSTINQQDTLYAQILEYYLYYFLPLEERAVPLCQASHNAQHSPVSSSPLSGYNSPSSTSDVLHSTSFGRLDILPTVGKKSSLLKKGTFMMVQSPGTGSTFGSSQTEFWRSETFLHILKEMYLNQNSLDYHQHILDLSLKTFVPSHYHVWMVRLFVKHLHFFFNSALSSSNLTGHGQIMIDNLGRLKSLGMTQLIQKEMYCFLKSTFDHWPLDASFRVPLETWLSYIQPWRYIAPEVDVNFMIWQKFMTENVLFYTSLYIQVMKRFLRMDFNCPKNAYMLFRVTKVFSTPEMREMIIQAEKGCISKPSSMSSPFVHRSPEKFSLRKMSNLEVSGVAYIPLFSEPVFVMVSHLLSSIASALEKAKFSSNNKGSHSRNFLSRVGLGWLNTSDDFTNIDDDSPADIRKVSSYLEASSKQLCNFFKEVIPPHMNETRGMFTHRSGLNESKIGELSTLDKIEMLVRKKKPDVEYQGNPDFQPVRTYEFPFLVHFFNELSQQLNEKYASEINRIYHQPTLQGKLFRKILAKPVTYYETIKSSDMQSVSRNPVNLPPRIYLRFLANKQLISYTFVLILLSYWFNYNPMFTVFFILTILTLTVFLLAILYPVPIETKQS